MSTVPKLTTNVVPAKPFADWLNNRLEELGSRPRVNNCTTGELTPAEALCCELGWMDESSALRRLWRYRRMVSESSVGRTNQRDSRSGTRGKRVTYGIESYPRRVVEDALEHAGVPFEELYPEIAAAEEVWLEPMKWCSRCKESRTPINGQCPFCDKRLSRPTGQKLLGQRLAA